MRMMADSSSNNKNKKFRLKIDMEWHGYREKREKDPGYSYIKRLGK